MNPSVKFLLFSTVIISLTCCDLEKETNESCERAFQAYIKALDEKDYEKAITYIPSQISREKIRQTLKESEKLIGHISIDNYKMTYGKIVVQADSIFKRIRCESTTAIKIKEYPTEGAIGRLEKSYGYGNVKFDSSKMSYLIKKDVNMAFIKSGIHNWVFIEYDPYAPSSLVKRIIPKNILERL